MWLNGAISIKIENRYFCHHIGFSETLASKLAAKVKSESFVPDTPQSTARKTTPKKKTPEKAPFKTKAKVRTFVAVLLCSAGS